MNRRLIEDSEQNEISDPGGRKGSQQPPSALGATEPAGEWKTRVRT